jgi:hypothetical protein
VSSPLPQLFFSGTSTLLDSFDFGSVIGGATSAPFALDLINAMGDAMAEDAEQVTLSVKGRAVGGTDFDANYQPCAERWFQVQVTAALNGAPAISYPWRAFGKGRPFVVPVPIAAGQGYTIEVRAAVPPGENDLQGEFSPSLRWGSHTEPLEAGGHAAGIRGVLSGLGDGEASFLVGGFALTASGSPDNNVQVGDGDAVLQGLPVTILAAALATSANDGNAVALTAGNAYWDTLSLGPGGIVETKSAQGVAPLSPTFRLPPPAGQPLLGHVHRPYSGGIGSADIYQAQEFGLFALTGSGLTRTLGAGQALADDNLVTYQRPNPVTLPPSAAAARLWLVGANGAQVVTSMPAPPDPRALALWEAATSSTDITALTDLRTYPRTRRVDLRFRFGAVLAAGQYVYATTLDEGRLLLRLPGPVLAVLDDLGTAATAGATVFDVEQWTGSAWVSIFATSPDRRPSIAYNASEPRASGKPTATVLAAGTRLRTKVASVPTAAVAPSGAEVVLSGEIE